MADVLDRQGVVGAWGAGARPHLEAAKWGNQIPLTPSQLQATQGQASLPPETSHFGFGLGHLQRAANGVEEETGGRVPTCQAVASPRPFKALQQSQEAESAALNRWGN